jgi:16S rRNA (guanine527-N7)-methyltransferase
MIAQKKLGVENEVVDATRAVATLGGRLAPAIVVRVPFLDERRQLIVVEKFRPSPSAYPRRPGLPATSPL